MLLPPSLNTHTAANLSTILGNFATLSNTSDAAIMVNALNRTVQLKAQRQLMVAASDYEISNNRPFIPGTWDTSAVGMLLVARTNTLTTFFPSTAT